MSIFDPKPRSLVKKFDHEGYPVDDGGMFVKLTDYESMTAEADHWAEQLKTRTAERNALTTEVTSLKIGDGCGLCESLCDLEMRLTLSLEKNKQLTAEGRVMREALRKIAEEYDADGSMRFEAQDALDTVSGSQSQIGQVHCPYTDEEYAGKVDAAIDKMVKSADDSRQDSK